MWNVPARTMADGGCRIRDVGCGMCTPGPWRMADVGCRMADVPPSGGRGWGSLSGFALTARRLPLSPHGGERGRGEGRCGSELMFPHRDALSTPASTNARSATTCLRSWRNDSDAGSLEYRPPCPQDALCSGHRPQLALAVPAHVTAFVPHWTLSPRPHRPSPLPLSPHGGERGNEAGPALSAPRWFRVRRS
jgi:hypothetical protein